jgi:sodium-independent sulfate anion transporter 11
MSALTGSILDDMRTSYPQYAPNVIASALAVISGSIVCGFGIFRLGFIVDFIPLPSLAAFMTGSALNIAMGQIPTMMGNSKYFDTRQATYLVFINFWKNIKYCDLNAALGLTALFLLYAIRFICNRAAKRYPNREKIFFFITSLRTAFVILLYLLISWLVNRQNSSHPRTSLLGTVPRGFQNIGIPYIDRTLIVGFASYLPSTVIVLLIEHIAIAKSFGRINSYVIDPNQELIAIGVTNIFGPFFGAYPATGSFSRTAIKSKAGVRTPLAGLFSGIIIIIAIYALTPVFFWISQASLAAIVIHAVVDLIVGPRTLKQFWQVSPIEFCLFWAGVIVTIFSSIENGIYVTIGTSGALLLYRIAKAQGQFVGRVQIHQIVLTPDNIARSTTRNIYVPLDHSDGTNPIVIPISPGNGIFIYRIHESFLYPNASHYTERMLNQIFLESKTGKTSSFSSLGQQPWNLQTSRHPEKDFRSDDNRPRLHALIMDFTGVPHIDITGIQNLVDVRRQLDHYADWKVDWHFVGLCNPWTKRALISAGFGCSEHGRTVFSVANVDSDLDREGDNEGGNDIRLQNYTPGDLSSNANAVLVPILDIDRPLFHADLDEAYETAVAGLSARQKTANSSISAS